MQEKSVEIKNIEKGVSVFGLNMATQICTCFKGNFHDRKTVSNFPSKFLISGVK